MRKRDAIGARSANAVVASIAVALFVVVACGPSAPGRDAGAPSLVSPSDSRISYVGRVDRSRPGVARLGWPATSLSFRFYGSSVVARLRDVPHPDDTPAADWIAVRIDDRPPRAFRLRIGEARYPVALDLPRGEHRVTIIKRTEAEVGVIELLGLELLGGARLLSRPRRRTRRIEILGDSITAGFGNLGSDASCLFDASSEDATLTYGIVAADALDAEASLLAWSGKGVLRNEDPGDTVPFPPLFDRVIPGEERRWDMRFEPPHAVIVNLGANDFLEGSPDRAAFVGAYRRLLDRVRAHRPNVPVLLVLSPMIWDDATHTSRRDARAWLDALLAERRAAGETKMEIVDQWADPSEGLGCQVHPNVRTHRRLGRELALVLGARLGW